MPRLKNVGSGAVVSVGDDSPLLSRPREWEALDAPKKATAKKAPAKKAASKPDED